MSGQHSSEIATHSTAKVTAERWNEAQKWELELWQKAQVKRGWNRLVWPVAAPILRRMDAERAFGDDWNRWWRARFDGYRFLPASLGQCVELGCGPYTNIRLMLAGRDADRVVCSDPLVRSYITFRGRWLAGAHAAALVEIDDQPIEACTLPSRGFDLVVMINVLDHVQDARVCLEKAVDLCKPGGILVLGQDLSDERDVARHPYDIGHPIRLCREDLEPYLASFDPLHRRDLSRDEGRAPELHYATLVFAGRKRMEVGAR
jgi:SAM-dependent methyltransferase